MNDYNALLSYARSETDEKILTMLANGKSQSEVAFDLDVNPRTLTRRLARIRARAEKQGYSPEHSMVHTAPDTFRVKGVSTFYGEDGQVKGQWVKTVEDRKNYEEIIKEIIETLSEDIPKEIPVTPPSHTESDLLNLYTITDYHLGMMSWHEETGADWDTRIAEQLLLDWFAAAIKLSPNSEKAVFAQIGDFMHWDGLDAVTPMNKHILDADTRFQKLVRVAIRLFRKIIRMLLAKHKQVHIIMAEGNHDPASSIWLREMFTAFYDDEPRLTVDNSADPYYCYEHGLTSLFFHHGHKRKTSNIDDVFAAKFRDVFGRTKYSYAHMGHLHSKDIKETNLMIVEQHRTLAAPDAYASRGGWISQRDAQVITYHKDYGQVGRVVISPEMVKHIQARS